MSPEEFQRRLADFMRQNTPPGMPHFPFGPADPGVATGGPSATPPTKESKEPKGPDLDRFRFKPREVKAHLDRFVIRQDEAKKVLSVALCDHYNAVREALAGKKQPNYAKQNVVLLGPTGVGKTYLIRSVAELIGVPFVKADATKFSETGYVGGDVEDIVRDLVRKAEGDVRRAEFGIVYIDEIDKLAAASNLSGRDVSGRGVQTNLLKLMEETEVSVRAPNDMAGQFQAMMDFQKSGTKQPSTINTKHILFIVSGAFGGLEKIVRKRLRESTIGFAAGGAAGLAGLFSGVPATGAPGSPGTCGFGQFSEPGAEDFSRVETRDFVEFGFEPEFIGRLPVRVVCHALDQEDLFRILKSSEGSIVRQVEQSFAAYGIELLFREDGLRRVAELAAKENTGARGLMTVCERVFRTMKFELPSTSVKRFEVTRELVDDPDAALRGMLAAQEREEVAMLVGIVHEFGDRFGESHGLRLKFTPGAAEWLVAEAKAAGRPLRDLCADRFRDFQFGLKLIAQTTGQQEFEIDEMAAKAPDKALSEWVVASYRGTTPQNPG
jgi:ATP-dependent protease Clp ATPase subunit